MKVFLITMLITNCVFAKTIVFVGDSLTEGYGIKTEEAYPAQFEKLLIAEGRSGFKVVNGGVSGSTTANAASRVKWFLKVNPEIIVLALGANDGLRGVALSESRKNLKAAIALAQSKKVTILLAPMKLPVNYGKAYRQEFEQMYVSISKEMKIPLLSFLLEGVGGVAKLNLADGIHPNPEGHKKVAQNLLKTLRPYL
jgi:acyl-CoA thioesterase I